MKRPIVGASQHKGFTAAELLFVLLIICILIALLFPLFGSIRRGAQLTACKSNLRQIGSGLLRYQEDWSGLLPPLVLRGGECWTYTCFDRMDEQEYRTRGGWANLGCLIASDIVPEKSLGVLYCKADHLIDSGKERHALEEAVKDPTQAGDVRCSYSYRGDIRGGYQTWQAVVADRIEGLVPRKQKLKKTDPPHWCAPTHGDTYAVLFTDGHVTSAKDTAGYVAKTSAAQEGAGYDYDEIWAWFDEKE